MALYTTRGTVLYTQLFCRFLGLFCRLSGLFCGALSRICRLAFHRKGSALHINTKSKYPVVIHTDENSNLLVDMYNIHVKLLLCVAVCVAVCCSVFIQRYGEYILRCRILRYFSKVPSSFYVGLKTYPLYFYTRQQKTSDFEIK